MLSSMPPFVLFFVGAIAVAFTKGSLRKAIVLAVPVLGGVNLWLTAGAQVGAPSAIGESVAQVYLTGLHAHAVPGGQAQPPLRVPVPHRGLPGLHLRAAPRRQDARRLGGVGRR